MPDYEVLEYLLRKIKSDGLRSFTVQEIHTMIRGQQEVIVSLQNEIDVLRKAQLPSKQGSSVYDELIHSDCIGSFHTH